MTEFENWLKPKILKIINFHKKDNYKVIINKCHSEIYIMKKIDSACESEEKAICTNLSELFFFQFIIIKLMFMLHLKKHLVVVWINLHITFIYNNSVIWTWKLKWHYCSGFGKKWLNLYK